MPLLLEGIDPVDSVISSFVDGVEKAAYDALNWERIAADILAWVTDNRWIFGKPWSYESAGPKVEWGEYDIRHTIMPRPYQTHYVRDQTDRKASIKPRQSEHTETSINENLYYTNTRPYTNIAHVFPTDEMGDAISNEKIFPAIEQSPKIKENLRSGAVRRYSFINGSMYTIIGALKRAGGRAGSKDIITFDETDNIPESVFGIYEELLSHSPLKLRRYISTGTSPNVGIDALVREGCGYQWEIKCPKCKRVQFFTFPDSLINYFEVAEYAVDNPDYQKRLGKVYIGCKYCKEYIDRAGKYYLTTSRWVAQRPSLVDVFASYYYVAAMIPWKTGREITRRFHELSNYIWQAHNEIWGVAFLKSDQRLEEFEIRACERSWHMFHNRTATMQNVSVGIDWGENSSWLIVIANGIELLIPHKPSIVYIEEINQKTLQENGYSGDKTDHVKRAKEICDRFAADGIVDDANGLGVDRHAYLVKWYPKRCWGAFFDSAEEGRQIRKSKFLEPVWNNTQRKVTISKVNSWRDIISTVRRAGMCYPNSVEPTRIVNAFVKHMQSLGIQPRWSTEYEREFEIVVRMNKNDHLACANIYAMAIWNKLIGRRFQHSPGVAVKKGAGLQGPTRQIGV